METWYNLDGDEIFVSEIQILPLLSHLEYLYFHTKIDNLSIELVFNKIRAKFIGFRDNGFNKIYIFILRMYIVERHWYPNFVNIAFDPYNVIFILHTNNFVLLHK